MGKFKTIICIALAVLLTVSCLAGCTGEEKEEFDVKKIVFTDEQVSDISNEIDGLIDSGIFYGGVSVMLNENEVYKNYFGMANQNGDPVNEDSEYLLSSATMAFTAVAVQQLVEDDKLSLSDTLGKYFDSNKYTYLNVVTVEDLLNASVSFVNYSSEMGRDGEEKDKLMKEITSKKKRSGEKIKEMVEEHILNNGVVSSDVANSNYYILGRIIEKVSGMGYDEYLQKNIFDKLEMNHTGFVRLDQNAVGMNVKTKEWIQQSDNKPICNYSYLYSSYGGVSTLDDMTRFYRAVLNKELCKTDIAKKALKKKKGFSYGFETDGKTLYICAGVNIHRVYVCINPETEEITNVFTNTVGDSDISELGNDIYRKVNAKINRMLLENSD